MATLDDDRAGAAPWLLSGPALLLFVGLLLVPLLLTLVLSFHVFSDTAGTLAGLYAQRIICGSSPIPTTARSLLRTAGLAFAVTAALASCSACLRPSCSRVCGGRGSRCAC